GDHGTTFGGNPLACTLGSIILKKVSDPSFLASVQEKGEYLRSLLNDLKGETKEIKEITGTGLMQGIRTKTDVSGIIAQCREEGLLVVKAAHNTLRFIPPLNVAESEIDRAVSTVKRVLEQGPNK
ncbi:MAG: aminotransferase class III-fold pyridoxal phosphate-dependent enzyme, partial [Chitinivibrionales bacterium]